jgi:phenylalanyl-tRNA synthetase beta chain
MKFSKKILETFVKLPADWQDLMEDVGLEIKSIDGDIMNLELLANRGDHYCYIGLANEIIGRTGGKIKAMPGATLPIADDDARELDKYGFARPAMQYAHDKDTSINGMFDIETDKCLAYSLLPLKMAKKNENRQTADEYILRMLPASGVNIILDVIDITNVVMLEYGQPAHVYDADKIKGKIHIRDSKPGESAALLFHEGLTELPVGTCVIADDEKILCVAGVIGCRAAEVDENTKNILLETALFDPVAIRKSSRAIGHTSIASQIFERGGDSGAVHGGARRAKKLYKDIGWEQSGEWQAVFSKTLQKAINLSGDFVRRELEIDISDAEIEERLNRYGFDKTEKGYRVPSWRVWDIKGEPADLIEELARSIGYNNLPSRLPVSEIGAEPTAAELRKSEIDSYLVHNGFYEVLTDNIYSPRHAALSPIKEHIKIANSVEGGYAFMKNNAIVQAAELVEKNLRVKNREIRAYEWGTVFQVGKDGAHVETPVLWGVINGANESALTMKGIIENLARDLDLEFEFDYTAAPLNAKTGRHPKRRARILMDGAEIGVFGEIHPALLSEFDIKNDSPVFFEFFGNEKLLNAPKKTVKYVSPSAIIQSTRDIAIAVPYGKPAGDVSEFIKKTYPQIAKVSITDIYDKPKESVRNITFALEFLGEHSTESLNALILEIMKSAGEFAKK